MIARKSSVVSINFPSSEKDCLKWTFRKRPELKIARSGLLGLPQITSNVFYFYSADAGWKKVIRMTRLSEVIFLMHRHALL